MRKIGNIELKVTDRSGFDKSHRNLYTMRCGTLIPALVDEVVPNTTIHLRSIVSAQMPPLATDAFANVDMKVEAFFVPYRLLYGGFENWITENPVRLSDGTSVKTLCPVIKTDESFSYAGSLLDFLGAKRRNVTPTLQEQLLNIFPFLAYHRIYDDWYRNSRIQTPLFIPPTNGSPISVATLPYQSIYEGMSRVFDGTETAELGTAYSGVLADGSSIMALRQRNFGMDYFTTASPSAQRGDARKVTIDVPSGDSPSFTIASLRAQNSLQQFAERNNFSYRAEDYYYINYGVRQKRGLANRALFLGQQVISMYSKSVFQTASAEDNANPFNSVGSRFGNASITGNDTLIDNFTVDEPGIVMVMASIVPRVTYNTGTRRYLKHFVEEGSQTDLANAVLQNVGNQPIYVQELFGGLGQTGVFGYQDRYAEYMDYPDEVHGNLKDGSDLASFALQRSFDSAPTLNSAFLQIPQNYLDQIFAVNDMVSQLGSWVEHYFDYKVVQPLQEYSIPSLQDPAYEHGRTIVVSKNGNSL